MKRFILFIWCVLFCVSFIDAQYYYGSTPEGGSWDNAEYNTTEGTDFWVTYMFNYGNLEQDVNLKLYLYAVAREQTTFQIQYADGSYSNPINVPAGGRSDIFVVDQSKAYITNPDIEMYKGMHVISGKPISLYALNQNAEAGSYDATNVLPTKTLGREYIIQTYSTDGVATEFVLLGTHNNTKVNIDYYEKHVETGQVTRNTINITLSKGETYLHRSSGIEYSLTGTTVCTNHPIAVFCGGQHADIPRGSSHKNHIYSQLYPASMLGKHFVIQNIHEHKKDFYRITAVQDYTTVKVNGTQVAILNANETYDGVIISPSHSNVADYIETDKNTLACFYATDGDLSNDTVQNPNKPDRPFVTPYEGAPAMSPIIPMELGCRDLIFATLNASGITSHYANIVTYKAYKNGVRLDGTNISSQFTDLGSTPFSYAQIKLSDGSHTLTNVLGNSNQDAVCSAVIYGLGMNNMGRQESYAYAPGSRILREVDMLINGQYINEKTICITQALTFTANIGGDYSSVKWDFQDYSGTTTGSSQLEKTHLFGSAGDYDISLIVGRDYPINCSNTLSAMVYDTVHATIHVKDRYNSTFHQKICDGESITLTGRDEDGNIQEFTYNSNYSEQKHFYTTAGCDSIVDVKIEVGYPETREISYTACGSYTWHGTTYTTSGRKEYSYQNEFRCPCTEYLNLTILQPVTGPTVKKTICANSTYEWNGQRITKEGTYTAKLKAANGCDSIATLEVKIENEYREEISETLCFGGSYNWRGKILTEPNTYTETSSSSNGCDSTFILHLSFFPDYSNIRISAETCSDQPYQFGTELLKESGTYTQSFQSKGGCDSTVTLTLIVWPLEYDTLYASICAGESYPFGNQQCKTDGEYKKTETNEHGCTKTTVLYLTVYPISEFFDTIRICEKALPYTYAGKYIAQEQGDYVQRLDTKNQYGCDSIYRLHLIVDQTIVTPIYASHCDYDGAYNHPDERAVKLQNLTETGIYRDTLVTVNGCDSVLELHLTMGQRTYSQLTYSICDDELPWQDPNNPLVRLNSDTTYNDTIFNSLSCDSVITVTFKVYPTYTVIVDTTICESEIPYNHPDGRFTSFQNLRSSQTLTQSIHTINDCDSTVTLRLTVNPTTYNYQYISLCEDAIPYSYGDHGKQANSSGEFLDTLATKNQYGCDSVLVLHLTVISTIIDEQYVVRCDNELPYNHPDERAVKLQNLTETNTYRDTLKTTSGCDSIIELHLQVWPTYEVDERQFICDNEQFDFHGHLFRDLTANTNPYRFDTILPTIHGCDSLVHLYLTVYPTYEFATQVKICASENYKWRDKMYYETGTYYDSLKTINGCDSVYVLELFKKPMLLIPMFDTICDNETYQHVDTLWYTNGSHSLVETMVWTPGMAIPQKYSDVVFRSLEDGCDSVVYRYYLQINKTCTFRHTATLCSNQPIEIGNHIYTGYEFELEPGNYREPFDTIIYNRYTTTNGCDSVYDLHATIIPAYRHRDTIVMCDNETVVWRNHQISVQAPGEYAYCDSFSTYWGCDSIYELKLIAQPTFFFVQNIDKCVDEDMIWHGHNLDHLPIGTHFFYDSLTTVGFACDSVHHLYLTVKDTTSETRYDTICRTEIYDFHGKPIDEQGYYHDTTLNVWGCNHYTYLHLTVVDPTVPTAWVEPICANDRAYTLHYTYTGEYEPIRYSVMYDEEGHFYGFEDIEGEPITNPEQLHTLVIDMPWRDGDSTKYPKPNYYNIKLVLDNGICHNLDLCSTHTNVLLNYPSWLTQQRFCDVIALYNEKYNGGYEWSHYQWYHGDKLLEGECHEYLYVPTGLIVGDEYHVNLTRMGETQEFQTCPITIVPDPIYNDYAPKMGYLSVVPTCVCPWHPYINILSRKDGAYRISTSTGSLVKEGVFRADATEVEIPAAVEGMMYIVQLWSYDTPEEPYRAIKIEINSECCTNHYRNIGF